MNKPIWASKTMWGFGLTALIAVAQTFGVVADGNTVAQIAQILTSLFGAYGLRDAVSKK